MHQKSRLLWSLGIACAVPLIAQTGCNPAATGASPSPSVSGSPKATTAPGTTTPTTAPTGAPTTAPVARTVAIVARVTIKTALAERSFHFMNNNPNSIDLTKYVVSYEYDDGGSLKMQHLRLGGSGKTMAQGEKIEIFDRVCSGTDFQCMKKEDLGGTGATTMGLQLTQGSLVLYKGVTTAADVKPENMSDYMQYGKAPAKEYTHVGDAVAKSNWDAKDKYAPAPAAVDKVITVIVPGVVGSTNWKQE